MLPMASIGKRPQRKYWYAYFRDAEGKQRQKSTGIEFAPYHSEPKKRARLAQENRRLAQSVANEFESTSRGNRTEAQIRKTLNELYSEVNNGRSIQFETTKAFLERWIERIGKTKSKGTTDRYSGTVNVFLDSLGEKAGNTLQEITPADVENFISKRLEGGRRPTTVATDLKALNAPFALALRQGLILSNPIAATDPPTGEKEHRIPFTASEIKQLINTASGEWKTAVLLGARQGLRLGDAVGIKWSNVDLSERVLRLRPQKTKAKKRDMVIPMHPEVEDHIMQLVPPDNTGDAPLCPKLSKAKPGGRSGLSRQFQTIMAEAGLEQQTIESEGDKGRNFNKRTFHSLRHSFVTDLEAAGVAPDQRMLLSGHSDATSHARYTHTAVETLREAISKI